MLGSINKGAKLKTSGHTLYIYIQALLLNTCHHSCSLWWFYWPLFIVKTRIVLSKWISMQGLTNMNKQAPDCEHSYLNIHMHTHACKSSICIQILVLYIWCSAKFYHSKQSFLARETRACTVPQCLPPRQPAFRAQTLWISWSLGLSATTVYHYTNKYMSDIWTGQMPFSQRWKSKPILALHGTVLYCIIEISKTVMNGEHIRMHAWFHD